MNERRHAIVWAAVVVLVVSVAVYANTLANGFVMDDNYNVVGNPDIRSLRAVPRLFAQPVAASSASDFDRTINQSYWRPLSAFSYALDYRLWGLRPVGYHLTNVLLHAAVCVLVLVLFFRLSRSYRMALAGALVFAVHPVHTEVVNLVTYRTELLAALFAVSALVVHLGETGRRWRDLVYLPLLYLAGLACKETPVTLPGWMFLLDLCRARLHLSRPKLSFHRALQTYLPLALCLGAYLLMRQMLLRGPAIDFFRGLEPGLRFLSVMKIYGLYVRLLIMPWPLIPFYDWTVLPPAVSWWDWDAYLGLFALLLTIALLVVLRSRAPIAAVGLGWWLLGLLPFAHLASLPVGAAERFLYLPSIGICLALGVGIGSMLRSLRTWRRGLVGAALVGVAVLMVVGTVVRNTHWKSDLRLQQRAAIDFPNSFNAYYNLGRLYQAQGRIARAIDACERANRILPNIQPNVVRLASLLLGRGDGPRAISVLDHAIYELGPVPALLRLRDRAAAAQRSSDRGAH